MGELVQDFAFETRFPPPALAPYVHNISSYAEHTNAWNDEVETPTASLVPMIIVLGAGWDYTIRGERVGFGDSFVAGLCTTPITMHSTGFATCMQVNFTVEGARRFLALDMHELLDNLVPLEEALGARGRKLQHSLAALNSWNDRFEFLFRILEDRILAKAGYRCSSPAVCTALQLARAGGPVTVNGLTAELGLSRKHLTQLFAREVGLSPGQFLRLRRFERALSLLEKHPERKLADIALTAGFADQAHFSREFQRYMGQTPTRHMAQHSALASG